MDTANAVNIVPMVIIAALMVAVVCLVMHICGRKVRRYEKLAMTDPLTGGLNRQGFQQEAAKYLNADRDRYALVTMRFCNYRQRILSFGLQKASQDLLALYRVLKAQLDPSEPIGRMDDATFCFLLKERQEDALRAWLDGICHAAEAIHNGEQVFSSPELRFGIFIPQGDEASVEEMMQTSAAVLSGGETGRYCFLPVDGDDTPQGKLARLDRMEQALKNGEFVVYMQPKVRMDDNRIVGAEALLRWQHPERGLLPPDQFLPLLEEYHVIHKWDMYLFEEVCRQIAMWIRRGWVPVPVSIDLSYDTLKIPTFAEDYARVCRKYDVPPELIEMELPGIVLQRSPLEVNPSIEKLHSYNFRCALDSFGRGTIPINFLRNVNVDTLKLDQIVMSGKNNNRRIRFVVEAILKLSSQLQIATVAEGVTNVTQIQYLKQIGCDMVQGGFFFDPMTTEEFCFRVFYKGKPGYARDKENQDGNPFLTAKRRKSNKFTMFSWHLDTDRITFSNLFSPVLEDRYVINNATALFRHSQLIHENDQTDFFRLLERCQRENSWIENTVRFFTIKDGYEWLEVYMHQEKLPSGEGTVISGALVNTSAWKNEIDLWKEKANRDALTGLYNREYFEQTASAALDKDDPAPCAIVFIDIDNLKKVNDSLGHSMGDDVICSVAKRLLGTFRHTDVVARYGGDEFVVFVNDISREDLTKRLQQLCGSFRYPYRNDSVEHPISASIGAAMFPDDGQDYQQLLNRADTALYVAKNQGKNQVVMYRSDYEKLSV